jgi:UDP-N-acetylmuramoylalanine--D-glutamate ligase
MKIAIWGMGVSGLSTLKYLSTCPEHEVFIVNKGPVNSWSELEVILKSLPEDKCFDQAEAKNISDDLDLIVLSPGIDPTIPELSPFKKIQKICEVELAFNQTKVPVIAVTGTNGKTSTVTLITEALRSAGKKVFLGGNIGTPFCEMLIDKQNYDFAVLELSSFQLELMDKFHAHISVILNITKSHMERYLKVEDYVNAKLNILDHQDKSNLFICHEDFFDLNTSVPKKKITESIEYDFSKSKMVGDHNKQNINVVDSVLEFLTISDRKNIVQKLVDDFKGVEFRLEYLNKIGNTLVYNDGKSTNTASTISALKSFPKKKVALLLGGKLRDKTQNLLDILECGNESVSVFSFGDASQYISEQIQGTVESKNIEEALEKISFKDFDIILFSPAFPSFDQYKNYAERGRDFERLVGNLS